MAKKKKTTTRRPTTKKRVTMQKAPEEPRVIEQKKKNPLVALVIALVIVLIIFLSLVYVPKYVERRDVHENVYNNFPLKEWEGGLWSVNIEVNGVPYTVLMHYHPKDVETIKVSQEAVDIINALATKVAVTGKGRLFISMNPDAPGGIAIAGVEIAKVLGEKFNIYNIPTKGAFSMPKEGYGDLVPVVTCEDAVDDTFVIYIREHESDFVGVPDGYPQCIVVQGTDTNRTIMAADRFVYALFNIIPAS